MLIELDLKFNSIDQKSAEIIVDSVLENMKCFVDLTSRFDEKFNDFYFKTMKKIRTTKSKKKKSKKKSK